MGKMIILITTLVVCACLAYVALTSDFSDYCLAQVDVYRCEKWNMKNLAILLVSGLFYGLLLGLLVRKIIFAVTRACKPCNYK